MLRYENGRATLRPISGSIRRSDNPIEDYHLMAVLHLTWSSIWSTMTWPYLQAGV